VPKLICYTPQVCPGMFYLLFSHVLDA
jgi:hypothetical protein